MTSHCAGSCRSSRCPQGVLCLFLRQRACAPPPDGVEEDCSSTNSNNEADKNNEAFHEIKVCLCRVYFPFVFMVHPIIWILVNSDIFGGPMRSGLTRFYCIEKGGRQKCLHMTEGSEQRASE